MDTGVDLEASTPVDSIHSIVLGSLVVTTGSTEFSAAEEIGHNILWLDFLLGHIDGCIDIVHGTILFLGVDAVQAAQFAQADNLVVLVIYLSEQFQGLAVLLGPHGLGAHDLALVQFAHPHLGQGAYFQVIVTSHVLGSAQAGDGFVKVAQLLVDTSLIE